MKIYHLVIAYNDKDEEIEYIQEYVEEDSPTETGRTLEIYMDYDEDYWDDEALMELIMEHGLGEA